MPWPSARRWIAENQFLRALNFCMLLPGPEAQQLATYIGWRLHAIPGGIDYFALLSGVASLVLLLRLHLPIHYLVPIGAVAGVVERMVQ